MEFSYFKQGIKILLKRYILNHDNNSWNDSVGQAARRAGSSSAGAFPFCTAPRQSRAALH